MRIDDMLAEKKSGGKSQALARELGEEDAAPPEGAGRSDEAYKEMGLKILGAIKAGDPLALANAICDLHDLHESMMGGDDGKAAEEPDSGNPY